MITEKQLNDGLVVQHNALIESCYRMSVNEKRIILSFISQLRRDIENDIDRHMIIQLNDFNKLFQTSLNKREVESAIDSLFTRTMRIRTPFTDKNNRVWERGAKFGFITSALYSESAIKIAFSPEIMPFLQQLSEQYTAYSLKDSATLTSTYAIRFYELFKQYNPIGKRTFSIDEIREMFGIEKKYKAMCDFKKRVIDTAVDEINNNTKMTVTYTPKKMGRKVVGYTFKFHDSEQAKAEKYKKALIAIDNIYKAGKRVCIGGVGIYSVDIDNEIASTSIGQKPLFEMLKNANYEYIKTDHNFVPVGR